MDEVVYHRLLRRQGVVPPRGATCQCAGCLPPSSPDLVAQRVAAFSEQLAAWRATDRIGIPLFVMPESRQPVDERHCLSCGERLPDGRRYRCAPCVDAIHIVVEGGEGTP
jgi:hypothetical protein